MAVMFLQLSLCVITVIQVTSSQSTYDVTQQVNDVNCCERTEHLLNQLVTAVSQLQRQVEPISCGETQPKECPADFTYVPSVNGCYKLVTRHRNWVDAGQNCRSREHEDAHLLVINSASEQLAVATMLDSIDETAQTGCPAGGTAQNVHGAFLWTAGQRLDPNSESSPFIWRLDTNSGVVSMMTYTNWYPGEPNFQRQQDGSLESCVNIWWGKSSYTWNDLSCSLRVCSVCEIDM